MAKFNKQLSNHRYYNRVIPLPMSIIEIDENKVKPPLRQKKATWQEKFRRQLYLNNYNNKIVPSKPVNPMEQDTKSKAIVNILKFIQPHGQSEKQNRRSSRYIYDNQTNQNYYSPYSIYIPLQNQSFIANEIVNTFPYVKHLVDTNKTSEIERVQNDFSDTFEINKKKANPAAMVYHQAERWKRVKEKYLCSLDSVKSLCLFLQIKKSNSDEAEMLHEKHARKVLREVFLHRIFSTAIYLRSSPKTYKNLQVSMQFGGQINEKTLPETMKTWYCPICLTYDCQRHQQETTVVQNDFQYINRKNQKKDSDHLKAIAKILSFYQKFKKTQLEATQMQQQERLEKVQKPCSKDCYLLIKKEDLKRLNMMRHKLISPLAKALLKLGIEMFSYNPCHVHQLFQSSRQRIQIPCSLVFLHFVVECDLISVIDCKLMNSEKKFLTNEKLSEPLLKIPSNPKNIKKIKQKLFSYLETQCAICFHNFVGKPPVDPRCSNCNCKQRGFCLPTCFCTEYCQLKRQGCKCKGNQSCQTERCVCFANSIQCQPGVCTGCFPRQNQSKRNNCRNEQILRRKRRKMMVGLSHIPGAGLGCFSSENYSKNDLIAVYSGENISNRLDEIRQHMITDLSFYNFDSPNARKIQTSIDARYKGNKARFINHCNDGSENLSSSTKFSNGNYYIALYAARDIKAGEELTFNYDGNGLLYKNHRDKYPFIRPPKAK